MKWFLNILMQYHNYKGRSNRADYWLFVLVNTLISFITILLDNTFKITIGDLPYGFIYLFYAIIIFFPHLALTVRRLHDISKSGWMVLIALIPAVGPVWLLISLMTEGRRESNQYGEYIADSESNITIIKKHNSEIILLIIAIWFLGSTLMWKVFDLLSTGYDFFQLNIWSNFLSPIISLIWAITPICLGFAVSNKKYRIAIFIVGGIYLLNSIYNEIRMLMQTPDDFIHFQF